MNSPVNFDVNKSIKQSGLLKTLLVLGVIGVIFFLGRASTSVNITNIFSPQEALITPTLGQQQPILVPEKNKCISGNFEEKKELWEIDGYFKEENGYYCPARSGYQYWEIWYKEKLPVGFTSATLRYSLKDNTTRNGIPPPAVFSYGDKQVRFYSIIVPDGDLKGVRFKDFPQDRLKEQINFESEMTATVKPRVLDPNRNEIKLNFEITYLSESGDQVPPEYFSKDIKVPTVSPEEEGAKKQFGFGTFNGDCIKPIWFEICP